MPPAVSGNRSRVPSTPYDQSPTPQRPTTTHISPRPPLRHRQLHSTPIHLQPRPTTAASTPPTDTHPNGTAKASETTGPVTAVGGRPSPQRKGEKSSPRECSRGQTPEKKPRREPHAHDVPRPWAFVVAGPN